jgi:uncharacterized protein (DUF302 family)
MKRLLTAAILACAPATSFAETLVVPSAGSVPETVERLKMSIQDAGARVFTVVDFGGGARSIGEDIGDLQLVIFGNPRLGAAALSADPMAALSLPAKVLVYNTGNGAAMAYEAPADMLAQWSIPQDSPVLMLMSDTLDNITATASK